MSDDNLRDAGAAGWLSKADDDLRVAQVILRGEIGVEWAACFHAQQAAEKALKGVLVHLGTDFPKTAVTAGSGRALSTASGILRPGQHGRYSRRDN